MGSRRLLHPALLAALVLAAIVAATGTAAAGPVRTHHCLVEVVGIRADGSFVTKPVHCYRTFADAMRAAGFDTAGIGPVNASSMAANGRMHTDSTFSLGVHYDGLGWTGSSITVTGSDCLGGWLNLSSDWINRISSTINGCPTIYHFDAYNLGGTWQTTTGLGGNLSALNNKANSIQYSS